MMCAVTWCSSSNSARESPPVVPAGIWAYNPFSTNHDGYEKNRPKCIGLNQSSSTSVAQHVLSKKGLTDGDQEAAKVGVAKVLDQEPEQRLQRCLVAPS